MNVLRDPKERVFSKAPTTESFWEISQNVVSASNPDPINAFAVSSAFLRFLSATTIFLTEPILRAQAVPIIDLIKQNTQWHARVKSTNIPALRYIRRGRGEKFGCNISRPSFALIVSGKKKVLLGEEEYFYGPGDCLLIGGYVTDSFEVLLDEKDSLFLAVVVDLEKDFLSKTLLGLPQDVRRKFQKDSSSKRTKAVSIFTANIAFLRSIYELIVLDKDSFESNIFSALKKREIYLRILLSPAGRSLFNLYFPGSSDNRIIDTSAWLAEHFREKVDMQNLATRSNLSVASFYKKFKEVFGLAPAQYVRVLRLNEAKRLMIEEGYDAAQARLPKSQLFQSGVQKFVWAGPTKIYQIPTFELKSYNRMK